MTLPLTKYLSRLTILALAIALVSCTPEDQEPGEALNAVTLIARSQEAFYVEHGKFTDSLDTLGVGWLGLDRITPNYTYELALLQQNKTIGVVVVGRANRKADFIAIVKKTEGQVHRTLCQGQTKPPAITALTSCPPGFKTVSAE